MHRRAVALALAALIAASTSGCGQATSELSTPEPAPTTTGTATLTFGQSSRWSGLGFSYSGATCWDVPGSVLVAYGVDLAAMTDGTYTDPAKPADTSPWMYLVLPNATTGLWQWEQGDPTDGHQLLFGSYFDDLVGDVSADGADKITTVIADEGGGRSGSVFYETPEDAIEVEWACP